MTTHQVGELPVHFVAHGDGVPVVVLHGAGVDHREMVGAIEPAFRGHSGYRRIYPDQPGMGRTPAPASLTGSDDVLEVLLGFIDGVVGEAPFLVVGHSAGAYMAEAITARRRDRVLGLALVCPLVEEAPDVPEHGVIYASPDAAGIVGAPEHAGFREYFVVHTKDMLDRYERRVAPGISLTDQEALARIGERWRLQAASGEGPAIDVPSLIVAGRQDAVFGYAGAWALLERYPRATFAVLDRAGHALPHEQGELLAALVREWLRRVEERGAA